MSYPVSASILSGVVKRAVVTASTTLIPAVTGKRIVVLALVTRASNGGITTGGAATILTDPEADVVYPPLDTGWAKTNVGEALDSPAPWTGVVIYREE